MRVCPSIGTMRFAKGHGTHNDFVVVPDPDGHHGLTSALAARLCDRRAGIGGDGVLRVVRAAAVGEDSPAEWFMDYRNADGSLAEMCGNGIRVFARYLAETGLATGPEFTVATRTGPRRVTLEPGGDVTVDLGTVTVLGTGHARVGGVLCEGLRIIVGNPHLACLTGHPLAGFDLSQPPELDPTEFPDGGNVELVQAEGPGAAAMRVYERGSGETRSCGTGAVAAAVAAASALGERESTWQVTVPGGQLRVRLRDGRAWLTGPAVIVAHGELDPEWLKAADAG
jgi:diaminopimelate epimerase